MCFPTPSVRYRGTSLIRKRTPSGLYRGPMPRILGGSQRGGRFLMSEVSLYPAPSVGFPTPSVGYESFKPPRFWVSRDHIVTSKGLKVNFLRLR